MALLAGIFAMAASALLAGTDEARLEMQLESAIHREVVRGDLAGAIEEYRVLASTPAKSRAVAARALYQMGQCLEKLGRRNEAASAYARVAREFGDEQETAARARARMGGAQEGQPGPRNLDFREGTPGKIPPGWFVPALRGDHAPLNWLLGSPAELRRTGCRSWAGCAVVSAAQDSRSSVGTLMQSFSAAAYKGKTVRLRGWLKMEAFGADNRAQMWMSVGRSNGRPGFVDNGDDRPVRTAEWTRCEIVTRVFEDATFIGLGVMSVGGGRAWVDDVTFEVFSGY